MENSITYSKHATCFDGPQAVDLFRAVALASSLGLFKAGLKMRGMSGTRALQLVTAYTGIKYKRGQYDQAKADLKVWIAKTKASIPQVVEA